MYTEMFKSAGTRLARGDEGWQGVKEGEGVAVGSGWEESAGKGLGREGESWKGVGECGGELEWGKGGKGGAESSEGKLKRDVKLD